MIIVLYHIVDEYRRASTSRTNEEANIQQPETGTPEETVSASKSPDSFSSSYCKNSIIASKNTRGTLAVGMITTHIH